MKEDETIKSLIDFVGGFKGVAYKKNLPVERKGGSELKVFTVTLRTTMQRNINYRDSRPYIISCINCRNYYNTFKTIIMENNINNNLEN